MIPEDEPAVAGVPHRTHRIPDGVAFGLLGAYLISRQFTQRIGLGLAATIAQGWLWTIPFLNNSSFALIPTGIRAAGRPSVQIPVAIASVVFSTIVGLIIYWAGWRFGERLAQAAAKPGSPWSGIWNPKQIARAERWMESKGMVVVFLARAIEYFALPANLVAGASEMRLRRWFIAHTAGSVVFAGLILWMGVLAKDRWPWLPDWVKDVFGPWALRVSIGLVVLAVIAMVLGQKVQRDQGRSTTAPSQEPSSSPPSND